MVMLALQMLSSSSDISDAEAHWVPNSSGLGLFNLTMSTSMLR